VTNNPISESRPARSVAYRLGVGCLILALLSPLSALLVPYLGFSAAATAALIGFLVVGGPEVFLIAGIALAGKEAWEAVKNRLGKMLEWLGLTRPAGRLRYNIGILLLLGANLGLFVLAYGPALFSNDLSPQITLYLNLVCDVVMLISVFVLGSQFWDKLKKLFTWEDTPTVTAAVAPERRLP